MSGYIGTQPVPQATQTRETFTATASQTSFATGGYQAGYIDVFLNGVKLVDGTDFTATNGSDVVLTTGAASGDVLEVVSYSTYEVNSQNYTGGLTVDNDGATVLTVDRATSDGTIIDVQKNGTSVGSIGNEGGNLTIDGGAAKVGLQFRGAEIRPRDDGVAVDGTVDLGSSTNRFKDLYLSGGVYLGGTGSANHLDDYEEGTWTPSYLASTTQPSITYDVGERSASYTKIGNMVYFYGTIRTDSVSGGVGNVSLSGLPFAIAATGAERPAGLYVTYQSSFGTTHPTNGYGNLGDTSIYLSSNPTDSNVAVLNVTDLGTGSNGNFMMFHGQYRTDA